MPSDSTPETPTHKEEQEDDFDNESLGERQPETCSMDEGYSICE